MAASTALLFPALAGGGAFLRRIGGEAFFRRVLEGFVNADILRAFSAGRSLKGRLVRNNEERRIGSGIDQDAWPLRASSFA